MGAVNPSDVGVTQSLPPLSQFQVRAIMPSELQAFSQSGAWGDMEKPRCDMAFLLIVPAEAIGGEKVFGLVVVWVHPHEACYHSLGEVAHKLTLLINTGSDWAYAFA